MARSTFPLKRIAILAGVFTAVALPAGVAHANTIGNFDKGYIACETGDIKVTAPTLAGAYSYPWNQSVAYATDLYYWDGSQWTFYGSTGWRWGSALHGGTQFETLDF